MDPLKEHTIAFTGLKDGEHSFDYDLGPDFFAASADDEWEGGQVTAIVRLEKSPTILVVHIHVEGRVDLRCDHCNGPLAHALKGDQRQVYHLTGLDRSGADDDDEVVTLAPEDHQINLTHYFYECVRLSLPIRRVHAEGACDPEVERALGAHAGGQEHEPDPRWSALNRLKENK